MAGFKRPSFLKKQKEQKRNARAAKKREDRQARRQAQRDESTAPEPSEMPGSPESSEEPT